MRQEKERCHLCFKKALEGKTVSLVCSGDAGIYGLASLMYEIGQEYDNASHPSDNTVHQQIFQRTFTHISTYELSDPTHERFDPFHRVFSQAESSFEHDPHKENENREAQYFMGNEEIDDLCACRFFYFVLLVGLTQCSGNKTVAGVGESCFAIFFQKGFDLSNIAVAFLDDCFGTRQWLDKCFHFRITLK